jgi:glyoxylase-like metal-dependent hydrolase (beta-lactamase superfamily II)
VAGVGAHDPRPVALFEAWFGHAPDCKVRRVSSRPIDVQHLGRDRVIVAYDRDGVIVDPGPASAVDALLAACPEPRALLLTHIHLDHSGAAGLLVRRFPQLRVYVHERGAPHLIDPAKLLRSAGQLYGDEMDRLWGEVAPVPEENVTVLHGGEVVEGVRVEYTPGHASHHVCYFDPDSGEAYTGDVAGVRTPPSDFVLPPTPPPDIDVERWLESIELVADWRPRALCLTHAGRFDDVERHLDAMRERLRDHARVAQAGDADAFARHLGAAIAAAGDEATRERYTQAAPPDQLWLGLERYWQKRREREGAAA